MSSTGSRRCRDSAAPSARPTCTAGKPVMAPEPAARPARPAVPFSSVRRLTPVFLVVSVIPVTPLCCAFPVIDRRYCRRCGFGGIPGGQHAIARTRTGGRRRRPRGAWANRAVAVVERERDGDVGALVLGLGQQRRRAERRRSASGAMPSWSARTAMRSAGVAEDVVAADEAGDEFGAGTVEDLARRCPAARSCPGSSPRCGRRAPSPLPGRG